MKTAQELLASIPEGSLFINGEWVKPSSNETYAVANPATGETIRQCAIASEADVNTAVASARQAQESAEWAGMSQASRSRLLTKIAQRIEELRDPLCELESLHNGKTVGEAGRGDLPPSWDIYRYYAGWADKFTGETIPVEGSYLNYTLRQPVGVVGAIVPWNYPLLIACWKIAPALAMGNSVVLKPAPNTPLTALALANIMNDVGLPKGVLNVVTGGGAAGEAIARHPDIDKVSFTGSTRTGRAIVRNASETNLKKLTLELGGKSPQVIFPDADLEKALDAVFWGIFSNKGEVCSAGSRVFLHEDIHDAFVEKLVARARSMKIGDPRAADTELGSISSQTQCDTVMDYIASGKADGATVACGGNRLMDGDFAKGFFIEPTVFTNVSPNMKIAREEIFGPVLAVMKFRDEDEVLSMCNDSDYGLGSAVWTRDITRAHRVAEKLRAGSVWINCYNGFDSASPFGGYKQSGWGREMGIHALESYTEVKSVWVNLG